MRSRVESDLQRRTENGTHCVSFPSPLQVRHGRAKSPPCGDVSRPVTHVRRANHKAMSVTGAVRAAGLPTGGDDSRPTPVLDGVVKTYRPARVLVVEPVRRAVAAAVSTVSQARGRLTHAHVTQEDGDWSLVISLPNDTVTRVLRCVVTLRSAVLLRGNSYCLLTTSRLALATLSSIHGSTGELHGYTGVRGHDVFASEGDALEALYAEGRIAATLSGKAVLGLAPLPAAGVALLLVATRVRVSVTLPGGHDVNSVAEAVWVKIPLRQAAGGGADAEGGAAGSEASPGRSAGGGSPSDAGEGSTHSVPPPSAAAAAAAGAVVTALLEYPVEGCHLYCHTADVTRPWPWGGPHWSVGNEASPPEPDMEFTWNSWLAQPFLAAGCAAVCPPLVQGLAECRLMVDAQGVKACVALLSRRSRLHPGTRYLARGLNDAASPGNEVECEQLLFRVADPLGAAAMQSLSLTDAGAGAASQQQQQQCRVSVQPQEREQAWCSVVWRRGTVPIRWGTELKSTVGEAELYVSARDPYNGTAQYFTRLVDTYASKRAADSSTADRADATQTPPASSSSSDPAAFSVTCVNLLRSSLKAPELLLTEHFHEGVRTARRQQPSQLGGVRVLNFDWHGNIKALGEVAAVEGLWTQLHAACVASGLSVGSDSSSGKEPGRVVTTWQHGLLRYNCADSLDRTNLASFFGAVQLVMEQATVLGLCFEQTAAGGTGSGSMQASPSPGQARQGAGGSAQQQQQQQQAVLAVMPGRRVTPGVVSLWAQQQATGRVNTVPDMPGVQRSSSGSGGGAQQFLVAAPAPVNGQAAQPGLPPGWESRTDAVRLP